jgi:hypothetical protein
VPAHGRRKGGPPYSMYDLKIKKGTNTSHYPYGARSPRRWSHSAAAQHIASTVLRMICTKRRLHDVEAIQLPLSISH